MPHSHPTTAPIAQRRVVIAATVGNMLEFYDFTIYSYFALIIGHQFFPQASSQAAVLLSFAIFALGFVSHRLSGIVLGHYADRKGRRPALTLTIVLMGLGSAIIGLMPPYTTLGIAAPLLITLARLIQGFAQGGEFGTATAMLIETGDERSRGYRARWQLASQGAASLLGAAITTGLHFMLSEEAMNSWGWRLPFLIGVLIVPVGLYLRRHLHDEFNASIKHTRIPITASLIRTWWLCVFSIMGMTVASYTLMYYVPTYSIQYLHLTPRLSMIVALAAAVMSLLMCPLFGMACDHFHRRKPIALVGRIMLMVLVYPSFWVMGHLPTVGTLTALIIVLMFFYTMGSTPAYALMPENFPKHARAGYLASAYAVSVALFGGTAQLVCGWLIHITGRTLAPAWYMVVCVFISIITIAQLKETGLHALAK